MTPVETTELVRDWTHDEQTRDLLDVLLRADTKATTLELAPHDESRASVEEFIEWLDSEDFERDAHERIRAEAWRG
jgi:hypothetical protein